MPSFVTGQGGAGGTIGGNAGSVGSVGARPFQVGDVVRKYNEVGEHIVVSIVENHQGFNRTGTVLFFDQQRATGIWAENAILVRPVSPPPPRNPQGPFKAGDIVRCILKTRIVVGSFTDDENAGAGWQEGREFEIRSVQACYNGRTILWPVAIIETGVFSDWVELVRGVQEAPRIIIKENFTIGSDIEVAFVKDKTMVDSEYVMATNFRDNPEFGTDHGGSVGEFRPHFGSHPLEHWANLKKSIRNVIEGGVMLEGTQLDSSHILGSHVVGGHIHFGIKEKRLIEECRMNLDYWLLPTIQPLFPKNVFMKRIEKGYGKMGSTNTIRMQPHGFEYRLVPSFIFDEKVAQGIFSLAYVIVKLTAQGKLKVRLKEADSRWLDKLFNDYNTYGLNNLHDTREESIKNLLDKNLLGGLEKYIYPLFEAIHQEREFSGDIAQGWGMKYKYVLNSRNKEVSPQGELLERLSRLEARQIASRLWGSSGN